MQNEGQSSEQENLFISAKKIKSDFESDKSIVLRYYKKVSAKSKSTYSETDLWAIENYRFIASLLEELRSAANAKYLSHLPRLKNGGVRIFVICNDYLMGQSYKYREGRLKKWVSIYQKTDPLTIGELWAVPLVINLLLMHKLAGIILASPSQTKDENTTGGSKTMKSVVLSFLAVDKTNWQKFFEESSLVEKILRRDPAKIYSQMDFKTRDAYRHIIEGLANKSRFAEHAIAEKVVEMAKKSTVSQKNNGYSRHIGFLLSGHNRDGVEKAIAYKKNIYDRFVRLIKKRSVAAYFVPIIIVSILIFLGSFYKALSAHNLNVLEVILAIGAIAPLSVITAEAILNFFFTRIYKPQFLFKMDHEQPVGENSKTMVVVNSILGEKSNEPTELAAMLEKNYLSNRDKNIFFGLLLAFSETRDESGEPTAAETQNMECLRKKISDLNKKYSSGHNIFYIFLRRRVWNESERMALEWERKRGKILEFNRLLRGAKDTSFETPDASDEFLHSIKYVITVDHNELLPKSAASRLIATISHPLNIPVYDPGRRIVESGYGIIQPRISSLTQTEGNTALAGAICPGSGWDHYSNTISDVYQDMFRFSLYLGKGIYDVDMLNKILWERFPENRILSHDHLEGFYCRCGYASDIQIFEEEPKSYLSYSRRLLRWIRGDVQCLPWVRGKVRDEKENIVSNPISGIQKWKILENVIGSLFYPALLGLIIIDIFLPNSSGNILTLLALAFLLARTLISGLEFLFTTRLSIAWRQIMLRIAAYIKNAILSLGFSVIFLGHLGLTIACAITKTLCRMLFTKKKLLEWQLFQHTNVAGGKKFSAIFAELAPFEIIWTFLLLYLTTVGRINSINTVLLVIWLASPIFAGIYGLSIKENKTKELTDADTLKLRIIALKTWRYFEAIVTAETNFLPPDHLQEHTRRPISAMTSATNIGMYLITLGSASDMELLGTDSLITRTKNIFTTLYKMDRHEGHFFNWYNVTTLKPMMPRYISTVDSGNLSAALLVTKQTFLRLLEKPLVAPRFWETVSDLAKLADKDLQKMANTAGVTQNLHSARKKLYHTVEEVNNLIGTGIDFEFMRMQKILDALSAPAIFEAYSEKLNTHPGDDSPGYWVDKLHELIREKSCELVRFYPWILPVAPSGQSQSLKHLSRISTLSKLETQIKLDIKEKTFSPSEKALVQKSLQAINQTRRDCLKIVTQAEEISREMNFGFLYSKSRKLFRIGYDFSKKRFDRGHYDLLASESRLTSFVAVAQNQAPLDHWVNLSRPLAAISGRVAMLSWGGSMFEYLFSQLFLPTIPGSLLEESSKAALSAQINFGRKKNIPWGISESSYLSKNKGGDWQYSLHGIPYLGLRQAWKNDLVVSPYSSFLALELEPKKTYENIIKLAAEGAEGRFGFYEAIDYNTERQKNTGGKVVPIFLSHHQSAILISISGFLNNYPVRKKFLANPEVEAATFMLDERVAFPTKLYSALRLARENTRSGSENSQPAVINEKYRGAPLVHLISNGRYKLFISNRGGGVSQFENIKIGDFQPDPTIDSFGSFCYLRDAKSGILWSAAYMPAKKVPDFYHADFTENEAIFTQTVAGCDTEYRVGVIWDENLEYRRLKIKNNNRQTKIITVAQMTDIVLSNGQEDRYHPAYNRLKIKTVPGSPETIIYSKRTSVDQPEIFWGFKGFASKKPRIKSEQITSREDFIGRGGSISHPEILTKTSNGSLTSFDFEWIYGNTGTYKIRPLEEVTIDLISTAARTSGKVSTLLSKYQAEADLTASLTENIPKQAVESFLDIETEQQMLSCLIFRKKHQTTAQPETATDKVVNESMMKKKANIYNNWPILCAKVTADTAKATLRQLIGFAFSLSKKGFDYNLVIITADGDGYFRQTYDNTQKMIEEFYNRRENHYLTGNLVVLREHEITPSDAENLIDYSNLFLDLDRSSLATQIEAEYKKI